MERKAYRLDFKTKHLHRMIYKLFVGALLGLLALPGYGQERASVSGFVRDASTGETLLMANVLLAGTTLGAATNNAGYYTLPNLEPGSYTIIARYIGFREYRQEVDLAPGENRRLDIELIPDDVEIDEVVVEAERDEDEVRAIGVAQITTETVRQLPTVLEPDVFRSLQLLPGVKAASDFSSGLYIRGGGPDQTLILLDRTTVYNPNHFFGFFSTFNPDAIKDVRLYKGGYPAQYGGRLGSVLDIYNKDGNRREYEGSLSLGLLASRALIEGPYAKGSWMLAVRRSTLEPLLKALEGQEGIPESFYFYDVNGKVNFDASPNDRLSLAFYAGTDDLSLEFLENASIDLRYGNRTVSANWTHIFSQRLFSNFTFTASRYLSLPDLAFAGTAFSRRNNVYDVSAKGDFEYIPNERHSLEAGFWAGNFVMRLQDTFDGQAGLTERLQTAYTAAYVQETYRPTSLWTVRAGLRGTFYSEGDYVRLEPRFSVEHHPTADVRLQVGYGRYYQFLTLITSELFSAFDIWLTTGEEVPPAYGDQFVAGVKTNLVPGLTLDVEGYYRTMRQLFELDPFLPDAAGLDYDELFHFGEGYAYGTEVLLQRTQGRLTGFLGYTVGLTARRFPNLKEGTYYAPKYDRTHDISAVGNVDLGKRWRFTGVFKYGTGQAYTQPLGQYQQEADPFSSTRPGVLITEFNNRRLPPYHRLDVGFSKTGPFFRLGEYEFQVQAINVYGRRNIWFYFFERDEDGMIEQTEVPQIPFPLPNVSLTLTF